MDVDVESGHFVARMIRLVENLYTLATLLVCKHRRYYNESNPALSSITRFETTTNGDYT